MLYCKWIGPVAWKIHSAVFLISSSLHSYSPSPTNSQNKKTWAFTRNNSTSKLKPMLVHEPAGRILIRPCWLWEITYVRHKTAAGREAGRRQALGVFHLTFCRLVSCNISFKEPGSFYLLRKWRITAFKNLAAGQDWYSKVKVSCH